MTPVYNQIATTGVVLFGTILTSQAAETTYFHAAEEWVSAVSDVNLPVSSQPTAVTELAEAQGMANGGRMTLDEFADYHQTFKPDDVVKGVAVEAEPLSLAWDL